MAFIAIPFRRRRHNIHDTGIIQRIIRCFATTTRTMVLVVLLLWTTMNPNHCRVSACTAILVGRKATIDGSVLASHSDDGEGAADPRIMYVPSRRHQQTRDIMPDTEDFPRYVGYDRGPDYTPEKTQSRYEATVPIGSISNNQSGSTHSYFDGNYGIMNSKQLIVGGESTCSAIFSASAIGTRGGGGKALFSINELSRVALEQTSTARDAIRLMGRLAERHGFYGPSNSLEGSAESLMVADPTEGFVFHILPDDTGTSAVWVAKRVPDDEITIVTNMFTIRGVNLTDTHNFIGTEYMYEVAERNRLWKKNTDDEGEPLLLDFTKTFSNGEYSHKYYSGRRMWGAFSLLAPSLRLDPEYEDLKDTAVYPWSVRPDSVVSLEDVFRVHRNYYQGTRYDMSTGLAAGPFGDPDRFTVRHEQAREIRNKYDGVGSWERPIAMFRTTYTTVLQARSWLDDDIGGVMWLGSYAPHGTCFLPFAVGIDSLPDSITTGQAAGDEERDRLRRSAFWTFRYMHTLARLHYSLLSPVIRRAQKKWEQKAMELQKRIVEHYYDPRKTKPSSSVLTELYKNHTASVLDAWWGLADELVFMFADGFDNRKLAGPPIGYSTEWLEAVGYQNGPPPPPTNNNGNHIAYDTATNYVMKESFVKLCVFMVTVVTLLLTIILKRNSQMLFGGQQQEEEEESEEEEEEDKYPGTPETMASESSNILFDRNYGSV